jgi:hypothetical protein
MLPIIEEVKSFSRQYVNSKEERTAERNEKIKAAYKQLTGENVRGNCGTCLIEAILLITNHMGACNYQLKKGARLVAFGNFSKNCTNKNITNELAEWHLSRNPTCARLFEKIPNKTIELPKILIIPPKVEVKETIPNEVDQIIEEPKKRTRKSKK